MRRYERSKIRCHHSRGDFFMRGHCSLPGRPRRIVLHPFTQRGVRLGKPATVGRDRPARLGRPPRPKGSEPYNAQTARRNLPASILGPGGTSWIQCCRTRTSDPMPRLPDPSLRSRLFLIIVLVFVPVCFLAIHSTLDRTLAWALVLVTLTVVLGF